MEINTCTCFGFRACRVKITSKNDNVTLPGHGIKKKALFYWDCFVFYITGESGEHWDFTCFSVAHEEPRQTATITVVTKPFVFVFFGFSFAV